MQHFYDGQIRRYITQVVRLLSNFSVKYGDGTLVRVPVMYGDQDRQAASVVNQNSENAVATAPRIAVYVGDLDLARERLSDSTFVSKLNIRERAYDTDVDGNPTDYNYSQGNQYTVERLMPTPFDLTLKVDIWSTSTDQKLQIIEQMLVLFNPSLEIQTTDNYIDWTSLSVVELGDVIFSSRSIPVGTQSAIDIATLTLKTPIFISPPVKVKKLGIITSIIANIFENKSDPVLDYIDGLGTDYATGQVDPISKIFTQRVTIGNFDIVVEQSIIRIRSNEASPGTWLSWQMVLKQFPGNLTAGLSKLFLIQPDETEVVGTVSLHPTDATLLVSSWDTDTFPSNTLIPGPVRPSGEYGFFDAIIDPTTFNPKRPNKENTDQPIIAGKRYLIVDGIGGSLRETFETVNSVSRINTNVLHKKVNDHRVWVNNIEVGSGSARIPNNPDTGDYYITLDTPVVAGSDISYELFMNEDGPDAWKNTDGSDTAAEANDIVEWSGTKWVVIFSASENILPFVYQTNFYTNTQYKWDGTVCSKSFEGEYKKGQWRIAL
jgi:hypothetical protein